MIIRVISNVFFCKYPKYLAYSSLHPSYPHNSMTGLSLCDSPSSQYTSHHPPFYDVDDCTL